MAKSHKQREIKGLRNVCTLQGVFKSNVFGVIDIEVK